MPALKLEESYLRLDAIRSNLRIDHTGKIRVSFELAPFGNHLDAVFECISCADLLTYSQFHQWWYCPSCKYEVTVVEARSVVAYAQRRMLVLAEDVKSKGVHRWRWVTWLLQLLRPKAALKP